MEEIWKPCFNYESVYEVSNFGRVRGIGDFQLQKGVEFRKTDRLDMYGNPIVNLKDRGRSSSYRVNKLVAIAFCGANIKSHIEHKNGDLKDVCAENLEIYRFKSDVPVEVTAEMARDLLNYIPETGQFFRKPNLSQSRGSKKPKVPVKTGSVKVFNGKKYVSLWIARNQLLAHRVAFLIVNGRWPEGEIDHKDGDGTNNRYENLRECTHADNCRNMIYNDGRDPDFVGLSYSKTKDLWIASAGTNQKAFKTEKEAREARDQMRKENGFSGNHGKVR
jgi:hypothetical protein